MTLILEPKRRLSKRDAPQFTTHIETSFDKNELIVSKTDKRGTIISCNDIFAKMSGWSEEELMGSNHNLIRHPDMPQIVYKLAWDTIKAKKEFFGYIKNYAKMVVFTGFLPTLLAHGMMTGISPITLLIGDMLQY